MICTITYTFLLASFIAVGVHNVIVNSYLLLQENLFYFNHLNLIYFLPLKSTLVLGLLLWSTCEPGVPVNQEHL